MKKNNIAFLDRDGVINVDRKDFVKKWSEFVFEDGVFDALRELREMGFLLAIVTNQSCVGRGIIPLNVVQHVHAKMTSELERHGIIIENIYVCPHGPDDGCDCRKPLPGNVLKGIEELDANVESSFMAGDSERDLEAGRAAGLKTVLVKRNGREVSEKWKTRPDGLADSVKGLPKAIMELFNE